MTPPDAWDPFKELMTVQKRMNALFESALARTNFQTDDGIDSWSPVADVYDTGDSLAVDLELPGLAQDDIQLRIEGDELVVEGERRIGGGGAGEHYHRMERSYGSFQRRFRLPGNVDREGVQAQFNGGLLKVTLPHLRRRDTSPLRVDIGA